MPLPKTSRGTEMKNRTFRTPVKATVAAVAGVALLAGVGGSFASWSETESVVSGTITQGKLSLSSADGSHWESSLNPGVPITNVGDYRVVPGEVLTFTDTVTLTAEGDQLKATLTTNKATLAGTSEDLDVEQTITDSKDGVVEGEGEGVAVDASDNNRKFDVEVTVEFPWGSEEQELTRSLADLEVTVTQDPLEDSEI
jgi:alternate signal-mediated exported protein